MRFCQIFLQRLLFADAHLQGTTLGFCYRLARLFGRILGRITPHLPGGNPHAERQSDRADRATQQHQRAARNANACGRGSLRRRLRGKSCRVSIGGCGERRRAAHRQPIAARRRHHDRRAFNLGIRRGQRSGTLDRQRRRLGLQSGNSFHRHTADPDRAVSHCGGGGTGDRGNDRTGVRDHRVRAVHHKPDRHFLAQLLTHGSERI